MQAESNVVRCWEEASRDLGIRVQTHCSVSLSNGRTFVAPVLVLDFGAPKGMLVTFDLAFVKENEGALERDGYGCLIERGRARGPFYNREGWIAMLADWGWSGPASERPDWLPSES